MKFKTIIAVLLLGLLALNLLSCRLNKQERRLKRDSETIAAIRGRSPELFADKSDTTQTEDSLDVGVKLVEDSAKIKELIAKYQALDSAKQINHSNKEIDLEQKALRHQMLNNKQRDIEREIARSGFKKNQVESIGPNHNIKAMFDPDHTPELRMTGTIQHLIINNKTVITLKEYIHKDITMKQAFWKLWPVWSVMLLMSLAGLALKLWIK